MGMYSIRIRENAHYWNKKLEWQKAKGVKMMTGKELFQKYMEVAPEKLPQFLQSLSWEDVQAMSEEMAKLAKEARDAGDTDVVLNLVSRSMPFLEYFEEK